MQRGRTTRASKSSARIHKSGDVDATLTSGAMPERRRTTVTSGRDSFRDETLVFLEKALSSASSVIKENNLKNAVTVTDTIDKLFLWLHDRIEHSYGMEHILEQMGIDKVAVLRFFTIFRPLRKMEFKHVDQIVMSEYVDQLVKVADNAQKKSKGKAAGKIYGSLYLVINLSTIESHMSELLFPMIDEALEDPGLEESRRAELMKYKVDISSSWYTKNLLPIMQIATAQVDKGTLGEKKLHELTDKEKKKLLVNKNINVPPGCLSGAIYLIKQLYGDEWNDVFGLYNEKVEGKKPSITLLMKQAVKKGKATGPIIVKCEEQNGTCDWTRSPEGIIKDEAPEPSANFYLALMDFLTIHAVSLPVFVDEGKKRVFWVDQNVQGLEREVTGDLDQQMTESWKNQSTETKSRNTKILFLIM